MMNDTFVTVCGNVVATPEQRSAKNGERRFTTFRIASTPRRLVAGEYVNGPTSFLNIVAFGRVGANALQSLDKGDAVIVHGRLRVTQWTNGERSGTSVEIDAHSIGHDLTWGTTVLTKGWRGWPGDDRLDGPEVRQALDEEASSSAPGDGADAAEAALVGG